MSECTHDCENCESKCESAGVPIPKDPMNQYSNVKKVYAVVSGKGGVGKSMVTALLAVEMNKRGKKTAILDADVTGPSIPKAFGLSKEQTQANELGLLPVTTKAGIDVMSVNLLLDDETAPVVWRGPVISGTVRQFWTDVVWGEKDIMFIDMPPGTGDVPLTVFQSLPIDGIIIVTSPQELVGLIVEKALNMAKLMDVPVVGIVENMSYYECDSCGKKHYIFGESHTDEVALKYGLPLLSRLPFDASLAKYCDAGELEKANTSYVAPIAEFIG
ncbi:MAG: Mrp/NBP35 family ATP-binding protein [Clostridia bacterium]|nr:Mrp/NBP35 family ATP-binding protein [Clostridia bacterium]